MALDATKQEIVTSSAAFGAAVLYNAVIHRHLYDPAKAGALADLVEELPGLIEAALTGVVAAQTHGEAT